MLRASVRPMGPNSRQCEGQKLLLCRGSRTRQTRARTRTNTKPHATLEVAVRSRSTDSIAAISVNLGTYVCFVVRVALVGTTGGRRAVRVEWETRVSRSAPRDVIRTDPPRGVWIQRYATGLK